MVPKSISVSGIASNYAGLNVTDTDALWEYAEDVELGFYTQYSATMRGFTYRGSDLSIQEQELYRDYKFAQAALTGKPCIFVGAFQYTDHKGNTYDSLQIDVFSAVGLTTQWDEVVAFLVSEEGHIVELEVNDDGYAFNGYLGIEGQPGFHAKGAIPLGNYLFVVAYFEKDAARSLDAASELLVVDLSLNEYPNPVSDIIDGESNGNGWAFFLDPPVKNQFIKGQVVYVTQHYVDLLGYIASSDDPGDPNSHKRFLRVGEPARVIQAYYERVQVVYLTDEVVDVSHWSWFSASPPNNE